MCVYIYIYIEREREREKKMLIKCDLFQVKYREYFNTIIKKMSFLKKESSSILKKIFC